MKKVCVILLAMSMASLNTWASDYVCHISTSNPVDGMTSVFSDDIDGDGDMDIVRACANSVIWYETISEKEKTTHLIGHATNPCCVSSADLDQDGDLDFIFPESKTRLVWYENRDGKGKNLVMHTIALSKGCISTLRPGDMDGDGDMDILTSQANGTQVVWYENQGNASFKESRITTLPPNSIFIASDMDGDNSLDVLTCIYDRKNSQSDITYHQNTGNDPGSFTATTVIHEEAEFLSLFSVDLDNDDDMDLVARLSTGDILWYENTAGHFSKNVITSRIDSIATLYPEDIDQDGRVDIVCKQTNGDIVPFKNDDASGPVFNRDRANTYSLFSDTL